MKLSVGPLLYYWDRNAVLAFYDNLLRAPVDVVYLGEVVCSKRRALRAADWYAIAEQLRAAGKEVVFSTLALLEAESELGAGLRLLADDDAITEANDFAFVHALSGRRFVAGPHLNVYNQATLAFLARMGAYRWVAPVELDLATLTGLAATRPTDLQIEVFSYGRLPLAFSARCFAARAHHRAKDDCDFVCAHYPDGITLYSREEQPFLALNGIQTQSAAVHTALHHVAALRAAGIDVLRLSPHSHDFTNVITAFRAALDDDELRAQAYWPAPQLPGGYCDGYLEAKAGMALGSAALSQV